MRFEEQTDLDEFMVKHPWLKVDKGITQTVSVRPSLVDRRASVKALDKAFSQFIRQRAMQRVGGCERCLTPKTSWKQLQCSHFWGRGRKMVRWNEANAVGICGGCHMYLTAHPLEHADWYKKHLGELQFTLLEISARTVGKPDIEGIWLWLKAELEKQA